MRIVLLVIFFINILYAHKLNLFFQVQDKQLYIYSYFASGAPCASCKVELLNNDLNILKNLKTNKDGELYIDDYRNIKTIRVEALGGHAIKKDVAFDTKEDIKDIEKQSSSYLQSLVAVFLIVFIFIFLKRFKK